MKLVIQRVNKASVDVEDKRIAEIGNGYLVFLGISDGDGQDEIKYMVEKLLNLRLFEDQDQKMNKSLQDISGDLLIVSQFTLYGDCKKGRRPSFDKAMNPKDAKLIYDQFLSTTKTQYHYGKIESGEFAAYMKVNLQNDGPVTIILEK